MDIILQQPGSSISDILKILLPGSTAVSTLNRHLKALVEEQLLIKSGSGRSTVYHVAAGYRLVNASIGNSYFDKDIDERKGQKRLNPDVFTHLETIDIFTPAELLLLEGLQYKFSERVGLSR